MAKLAIYNQKGEKSKDLSVSDVIFAVEANSTLISQAVLTARANKRAPIAHTKTRGEVSGGGRKPFKQKGTGNARAGSTRSPLWIGGGITFGPRNTRNYSKRIPSKMKTLALRIALSEKVKANRLIVLDKFTLDGISTKKVREVFEKLPIEEGKILMVIPSLEVNLELSMANIPYVKVVKVNNLNILDLLKYDYLVATVEAMERIEMLFSEDKVEKENSEVKKAAVKEGK